METAFSFMIFDSCSKNVLHGRLSLCCKVNWVVTSDRDQFHDICLLAYRGRISAKSLFIDKTEDKTKVGNRINLLFNALDYYYNGSKSE